MQQIAMTESSSLRARSPAWTAVGAGMLALASSLGIGRFVYTPILPSMAASLGLSASGAGLIASANFAGYLAGAIVAALPRLHGGRRAWFVGGLLVGAVTTMAMGLASGLPLFLILRFLGGASSAFVLVLATAAVLDVLAAARRTGLRWVHYAGVGVGIAVSAVAVSALEAAGASWRALWLAAGAIAAVMLVPPALTLRWRAPPARVGARVPLGRGLIPLTICHGLFGFGYVITATFLIAIVRTSPSGRSIEPLIWLVVGLSAAPSLLPWDWVAERLGSRRAYAAACVLQAASVLAAGGWPTPAGLLIAAFLLGGTIMGLTGLGFAAARELGVEGQERRFAVITVGFGLGQVIGPVVGGAVSDWTGGFWAPSVLAAAALLIAAALMVTSARRKEA